MSFAIEPLADAERRTTLVFQTPVDPGPVIQAWAASTGYRQVEGGAGPTAIYQKGSGFWVAPMMLAITRGSLAGEPVASSQLTLQAWVRAGFFVRLMSFFILPAEMHVRSGGMRAMLPRKIARSAVNQLLAHLGQPPIA
jgi:hypothetical protein